MPAYNQRIFFFPGGPQPLLKPEPFKSVCLGLEGLSVPNKKDSGVRVGARHPGEGWLELHVEGLSAHTLWQQWGLEQEGSTITPTAQEKGVKGMGSGLRGLICSSVCESCCSQEM